VWAKDGVLFGTRPRGWGWCARKKSEFQRKGLSWDEKKGLATRRREITQQPQGLAGRGFGAAWEKCKVVFLGRNVPWLEIDWLSKWGVLAVLRKVGGGKVRISERVVESIRGGGGVCFRTETLEPKRVAEKDLQLSSQGCRTGNKQQGGKQNSNVACQRDQKKISFREGGEQSPKKKNQYPKDQELHQRRSTENCS